MNTQAIDTAKSLQRIQKYLERLELAKGYHKECVHVFINKDGDEIPLLVADLKVLLQQVTITSSNTDARDVDAARYQALVKSGNFAPSPFDNGMWGLRVSRVPSTKAELDAAVDRVIAAQAKQGGV